VRRLSFSVGCPDEVSYGVQSGTVTVVPQR